MRLALLLLFLFLALFALGTLGGLELLEQLRLVCLESQVWTAPHRRWWWRIIHKGLFAQCLAVQVGLYDVPVVLGGDRRENLVDFRAAAAFLAARRGVVSKGVS